MKDLNYWKNNAEEDYITTPISVLRYITELEKKAPKKQFFIYGVVKRLISFKWLQAFALCLLVMLLLILFSKYVFEIPQFTCGWISCASFMLVIKDIL